MKTTFSTTKQHNREKGFTLVEVMVAIGLFAIGILAVASMIITASNSNRSARLRTEAVTLVSERLESLVSAGYASMADGSASEGEIGLSWTIQDNSPIAKTKTITVTASWADRGGSRIDDFRYIISDPG